MPWVCASTKPRTSWIDETPLKVRPEMLSCTSGQAAQPATVCSRNADGAAPGPACRRRRRRDPRLPSRKRYVDPRRVTVQSPCSLGARAETTVSPGRARCRRATRSPCRCRRGGTCRGRSPGSAAAARGDRRPLLAAKPSPARATQRSLRAACRRVAAAGHRVAVLRHGAPGRGRRSGQPGAVSERSDDGARLRPASGSSGPGCRRRRAARRVLGPGRCGRGVPRVRRACLGGRRGVGRRGGCREHSASASAWPVTAAATTRPLATVATRSAAHGSGPSAAGRRRPWWHYPGTDGSAADASARRPVRR